MAVPSIPIRRQGSQPLPVPRLHRVRVTHPGRPAQEVVKELGNSWILWKQNVL